MEVEIQILDTLFRRISPGQVLQRLRTRGPLLNAAADRELFRKFAPTDLKGYSLDEHDLFYSRLQSEAVDFQLRFQQKMDRRHVLVDHNSSMTQDLPLPTATLYNVLSLADRLLVMDGQEPCCQIEHVLPWRDAYLLLGQDLFVCAYVAMRDLENERQRKDFTWPAVIRTNYRQLNRILSKGLAENHQHLYGSSQSFALSWISAMNHPDIIKKLDDEFGTLFQPFTLVEPEPYLVSSSDRVRYASLCRIHLFRWLKKDVPREVDRYEDDQKTRKSHTKGRWAWLEQLCPELKMIKETMDLRRLYGAEIPQRLGGSQVLDYALEESIFMAAPDAHYRSLAGERHFLYQCFRAFLNGDMSEKDQGVFYLYLILKALFRSELIQINGKVGFHNFSDYQDRKDILLQPWHWEELYRMALNAPQKEECVTSLETRIVPQRTARESMARVQEADESYDFANQTLETVQESSPFVNLALRKDFSREGHFYVFHFVKGKDDDPKNCSNVERRCRHQNRRNFVREQATGLAQALSESPEFCARVRGIDAASHEFGCPPEVFAQAYRFLRDFRAHDYFSGRLFCVPEERRLGYTYHAGEDFLDLAGALRTIDEAVELLELKRGDRIGHALGLGVDPALHYQSKQHRIIMRKQERLDDLIWLIYRGNRLLEHQELAFFSSLKEEARRLMLEIYGDAIYENGWDVDLLDYFHSMQLRGDDPESYLSMRYEPYNGITEPYEEFSVQENPTLDQYRKSDVICGLYYYYHFGKKEKICGNQTISVEINARYAYIMGCLQDAMQKKLAKLGIAIECNPSSNVLIGTFGRYQAHPIFRFHNAGLEKDKEKLAACSQLRVSVNTDDLGVFDTSLAFEYALLFHTLKTMTDERGEPLYTDEEILDYLDDIRNMGHDMAFLPSWNSGGYGNK